ncbi:YheC/YheD family protein [Paenibacillus tarimensis]
MLKKEYRSKAIQGKLRVCRYLSEHPELQKFVPATQRLSLSNLRNLLDRFDSVYIKPDVGSLGIGVSKLVRSESDYFLYVTRRHKQKRLSFQTVSEVYKYMMRGQTKPMIVQQAISLDRVNERPYDIRVMVQRKPGGSWTCTGTMAKVGAPNRIVTNYFQGGEIMTLKKVFTLKGIPAAHHAHIFDNLYDISLAVAKSLSKKRKGMHEMGIDFAVDADNNLWVLEVNSNHPQFHPLKRINRKEYNRMRRYAISYGRYSAM